MKAGARALGNQLCPVITVYTPADLSPVISDPDVMSEVMGLRPRKAEKSATVGGVDLKIESSSAERFEGIVSFETALESEPGRLL